MKSPPDAGINAVLAALLARCAEREHSAFSDLYRQTSAKLFGVALRILRREDRAAEVLQDCFMSIWTNASTYNPTLAAPMTWMVSIVRNRCLDRLRRPQLEVAADADDGEESLIERTASLDPGPLERLAGLAEAARLRACIEQLEARQRQAIALAYYDGLSHIELATHLQEPLGTVKTWVRRGLIRLKDCMGVTS